MGAGKTGEKMLSRYRLIRIEDSIDYAIENMVDWKDRSMYRIDPVPFARSRSSLLSSQLNLPHCFLKMSSSDFAIEAPESMLARMKKANPDFLPLES